MGADFKFDQKAFERQVKKDIEPQMRSIARNMEQVLADLTSSHQGESVEKIRPLLQVAFTEKGLKAPTEPELTTYAKHISEGIKVEVRVKMD